MRPRPAPTTTPALGVTTSHVAHRIHATANTPISLSRNLADIDPDNNPDFESDREEAEYGLYGDDDDF